MLIKWGPEWMIGEEAVDYDHQMLVSITNEVQLMQDRAVRDDTAIQHVLDQLVDYVEHHFAREEAIFMQTNYPRKQIHVSMHCEFERVVRHYVELFRQKPDSVDLGAILSFLQKWLLKHIRQVDFGFQEYLPEVRERRAPPTVAVAD